VRRIFVAGEGFHVPLWMRQNEVRRIFECHVVVSGKCQIIEG
jgi:hypothetical protein